LNFVFLFSEDFPKKKLSKEAFPPNITQYSLINTSFERNDKHFDKKESKEIDTNEEGKNNLLQTEMFGR
jgi:hypothetical protein